MKKFILIVLVLAIPLDVWDVWGQTPIQVSLNLDKDPPLGM